MGNIVIKISALIFGIALWFMVISKKDFQLTLDVPLQFVKLPENMAIASKPPQTVKITVTGPSLNLIRLSKRIEKKPKTVTMEVDLKDEELGTTKIRLGSNNFVTHDIDSIRFVESENSKLILDLDLDAQIPQKASIQSNLKFIPAQGYLLADDPQITPDTVTIFGARNVVATIHEISTDHIVFDSLVDSQVYTVPLDLSPLPTFATPTDSFVPVTVNVQKTETKSFSGIPVSLIGFYDRTKYYLDPDTVSIEFTGGKQALDSLSVGKVIPVLEFNRFEIEDADSLQPSIKLNLPANINRDKAIPTILVKPEYVKLRVREKKPLDKPAEKTATPAETSTTKEETSK